MQCCFKFSFRNGFTSDTTAIKMQVPWGALLHARTGNGWLQHWGSVLGSSAQQQHGGTFLCVEMQPCKFVSVLLKGCKMPLRPTGIGLERKTLTQ